MLLTAGCGGSSQRDTGESVDAAGKNLFTSAGCGACHALAAAGSSGRVGPSLDGDTLSLAAIVEVVTDGRGAMPRFRGILTAQQIDDVSHYIEAVAG